MEHLNSLSSNWKPLYEAALLETDPAKVPERIRAARNAILDSIEENLRQPLPTEQRAMNDALRHLRHLSEITMASVAAVQPVDRPRLVQIH